MIRGYALESQVTRFPRIVVGENDARELKTNPALWVHDADCDLKATRSLLRRDFDGEYFVDYLRVIEEELDGRSKFRHCPTSMTNSSGAASNDTRTMPPSWRNINGCESITATR